jgi:hypothetical protein
MLSPHSVVAAKGDISQGGCTGSGAHCAVHSRLRAIDLWWQTAKALCFSRQPGVITIHALPRDTPTTRVLWYRHRNPRSTSVCR